VAQEVESQPSKCEALNSNSSTKRKKKKKETIRKRVFLAGAVASTLVLTQGAEGGDHLSPSLPDQPG
jgi:glucokinase